MDILVNSEIELKILNNHELAAVFGGDAAATRAPGTNSWGERDSIDDETAQDMASCLGGMRAASTQGSGIISCAQ